MCLNLSQVKNKPRKVFNTSWYRELKENGKITCYKILEKINVNLESPFLLVPYQVGWNKSDRKSIDIYDKDDPVIFSWKTVVQHGIHVYRTKRAAKVFVVGNLIVPVTCYLKDLVAMGLSSEAVFMKVFLKKADHDKAIN